MEASGSAVAAPPAAPAAIEKRQYKNNTLGWLGVVILDHQGKPTGVSIEPQGTIWLSDAEAILTARAPRLPKDNPFEEQVFLVTQADGSSCQERMRPLVPITQARWVPSQDRYVPPVVAGADEPQAVATAAAAVAATADEPSHRSGSGDPVAEVSEAVTAAIDADKVIPASHARPSVPLPSQEPPPGDAKAAAGPQGLPQAPNVPPGGASVGQDGEPATSWTEPPNGQMRASGSLTGENGESADVQGQKTVPSESAGVAEGAGAPSEEAPGKADATAVVGSKAAAAAVVGSSGAEEETASAAKATPDGEETGAAKQPAGDAAAGEFAKHEETGSPDAPAKAGEGA